MKTNTQTLPASRYRQSIASTSQSFGSLLAAIVTAVILFGSPRAAEAIITTYTDRAAFLLASGAVQTLDFEGVANSSNLFVSYSSAVGYTNSGVNFVGSVLTSGHYLFLADSSITPYNWNSGDSLLFESRGHLTVTLPANTRAVGFDYMAEDDSDANTAGTPFTFTMGTGEVYTGSTLTRPTRTFFGVISSDPIATMRLETTNEVRPPLPIIDNFSFGNGAPATAPEIAVFDGLVTDPQLTDNTGTQDFGTVNVGGSSAAQTFTIRNDGTADLTGIAVTKAVTGNPGDFTVNTAGMLTTLAPNATTSFTVTFTPTDLNARAAVVQIASNDGDENPFEINVSGTGAIPLPVSTTFSFTGGAQIYTVPAGVTSIFVEAWGAQGRSNNGGVAGGLGGFASGNRAVTPGQVLTIQVGGGGGVSTTGGYNGGGNAGSSPSTGSLGGGGGGGTDVRTGAATLNDRFIVAAGGGGAAGNRVVGAGRGTGGGGGGGYYGGGGGAGWPFNSGILPTGGNQSSGGIGGVSNFNVIFEDDGFPGTLGAGGRGGNEESSNQAGSFTGSTGASGGGLTGSNGTFNGDYVGQSGAGGSSYIGGVTEGLTTPGLRLGDGQVIITYTLVIPAPEIAVEQPAGTGWTDGDTNLMVEFGTVDVAVTTSKTFTIRNTGTSTLSIGAITFDGGSGAGYFSVTTPPPASIAAGGTGTFVVTFAPQESGSLSAWMRIVNGDADETPFDIRLRGRGTDFVRNTWMAGGTPLMVVPPSRSFYAGGLYFATELGFVPMVGVPYVFLDIQGASPAGIIGFFNDLPEGGVVAMVGPGGEIYYMQATYTGGTGNDLALTRFNAGAPAWTWTAGPKARNGAGIYGIMGEAAPTNNPGARQGAMQWLDEDGRLFLFGGYGYGASVTSRPRYLNDLWVYDRELGQWIWASGSTTPNAPGDYGAALEPTTTPGARHTGTTWFDPRGFLWLFGGYGPTGRHNDLWSNRGGWAHVKGSTTTDQPGVYGTQGVSDVANTPGARQGAVSWFTPGGPLGPDDISGVLWLFGGTNDGGTTNFNDLWRFDIGTEEWTWVSGSSTTNSNGTYTALNAAGTPSARRDATTWVANDGTLWLFGGRGLSASGATLGDMSDVWRYNTATNVWTWISGPSTHGAAGTYTALNSPGTPAARSGGSGWRTVDGKFWLVGGFKNSADPLNDVWIYNPATNVWTWKLGSSTPYATGTYGTLGEASATNQPSARFTPSTWVTLNGDLWLFGGGGMDGLGGTGRMSDLWSYGIPNPVGAPYEPIPDPFPDSMIVNADPSAFDATAETMSYVPVSGQLTGFDADRDPLTFSAAGNTISQGILTLNPDGTWTYTPAPGFTGSAAFQFKASDNYGGESAVRTLVITVSTNLADSDGDGIADGYEYQQWGSLASADGEGDADLDGQSNYFEFLAGTDPLDAGERLDTAPSVAGAGSANGSIKLSLTHVRPGVNYHLETSTDLDVWTRLGTFTFSVAGAAEIEDPAPATGAPKFYRMNLEATPAVILP